MLIIFSRKTYGCWGKPTILGNPHIDMKKSADMFFITPTAPERLFARPTTDLILVRVDVHLISRFQFSLQCNMWQPLIALMKLHLPMRLVCPLSYASIFSCFVLISSRSFLVVCVPNQEEMEMLQEHLAMIYLHLHLLL